MNPEPTTCTALAQHETALARRIKRGDISARNELALANEGLVRHLIAPWAARPYYDDLLQEGMAALLKAAEMYDPEAHGGVHFGAYARTRIWKHIYRCLAMETKFNAPAHVFQEITAGGPPVADLVSSAEELANLARAFRRLHPIEAELIARAYGLGNYKRETLKQIRRSLGISEAATSEILQMAVISLRRFLRENSSVTTDV